MGAALMRRQLTSQERLLIALGALIVVLLLGYAVISGEIGSRTDAAERRLTTARDNYRDAVDLVEDYINKGRLIEEHKERIKEHESNFDLASHVTSIEDNITPPFRPKDVRRPTMVPLAGGKYTLTRMTYTYQDKSIDDIVRFLYQIEDPGQGIIISNILIQTENERTGDSFRVVISLSVVTQVEGD
jgi:hypothetical protein